MHVFAMILQKSDKKPSYPDIIKKVNMCDTEDPPEGDGDPWGFCY